jgi:hypothetical protein
MRRGEDPVPKRERDGLNRRPGVAATRPPARVADRPPEVRDPQTLLHILERDPVLRYSEAGRHLVRWLSGQIRALHAWPEVAHGAPLHTAQLLAELAVSCAQEWRQLGAALDQRVSATEGAPAGRAPRAGRSATTAHDVSRHPVEAAVASRAGGGTGSPE